jgi:hypothetical protein
VADPPQEAPAKRTAKRCRVQPMESQRYEQALNRKGAKEPCAACGEAEWLGGDAEMGLSRVKNGALIPNEIMKVLPMICKNCGFVRLHSTDILLSDS